MDKDFLPYRYNTKITQINMSANIGTLDIYQKKRHSIKYEILAKIQDTHVAKLWDTDHV